MKNKRIFGLLLSLTVFASSLAVYGETESEAFDRFDAMSNYAANLYIDESVDVQTITEEALRTVLNNRPELSDELIKAAFKSLDEYSEYYTREEYELFNKNMNHIVYGIGVIIQKVGDYVTIMNVQEDGGAKESGVQEGDKISKVDGVDVKGYSVDKVQDMVVGELGTDVCITFLRGEVEYEVTITRREVKGTTVSSDILEGNIGYIAISNFAADTDVEFADALDSFDTEGVTKIILDLRGNPGGYLDSAVNAASTVVPEGLIVSTVFRNEYENQDYYSSLKDARYELAVLVDENTASAAEVMSSAIKESGVGVLVGNDTYGKGLIQQMFEMWDGSAFKITTGKYFTREGNDIQDVGVEPDFYIDNGTKPIDLSRYQTFDYKTKPTVGDNSQNVIAAKERLNVMGYYFGELNNTFDQELSQAVAAFQADNGLYPYGVLDISTQVKLENNFYILEELVDNQLIYAYEYFGGNVDNLYK